ncbi:hypothetical protein Leryth_000318 [Lithospermum erythrorhizon]|nr:hypothetical protein Leryth_000318 [Lithospermum erythrorhizon]
MVTTTTYQSERARTIWRSCIASAFRTALACTIVGCITLFSPEYIKNEVAFPAFSYVTVILIVTDATLGDTLRGCWLAICASIQGVCPAILSLWLIKPDRLTVGTTAVVVAVSAFVVVLPENTHLISKRIALGQIVITYVIAFVNGDKTEPVMHPIHVAASTAVGVFACVVALLFPYPNLACYKVKKDCKIFSENASERLKLFLEAFYAEDNTSSQAFISQAKLLAASGAKILQTIKSKQVSMQWEKIPFKSLKPSCKNPGQRFQDFETPLKGMEIALSNSSSFPAEILNAELKDDLEGLEEYISHQFKSISINSETVPETDVEKVSKPFQTLQNIPTTQKYLPSFFFLFCMKLLQNKSIPSPPSSNEATKNQEQETPSFFQTLSNNLAIGINSTRLMPAFKSSLSLGLAVLVGALYSKQDAIWAGLPVAISYSAAREATFKIANIKAQGTVLGTVYGVIGCFIFEKFVKIRFISLLPWFIISSFLRKSKMYGQAGGISAVIGAVLILGRKGFGPPSEFAIARITETFIGLSCSIMVDLLLQPTRASTLAKLHLSKTLNMLGKSVSSVSILHEGKLNSGQKEMNFNLIQLKKFIEEAEVEPNFWFVPFNSGCYNKLWGSLSKMTQFLHFGTHAIRFLEQESTKIDNYYYNDALKEIVSKIDCDLKLFKDIVCSSIKCFEEVSLVKSLQKLEKELEKKKVGSFDIEVGKSPFKHMMWAEDEIEKGLRSFLQNCEEFAENITSVEKTGESVKSQLILSLSTLGFCMSNLVKETKEIEKGLKELVQWENPTSQVNLHETSCKMHSLANANEATK